MRRAEKKTVKVAEKNKLARLSEENWICRAVGVYGNECGNDNFARRANCNICKAPNPVDRVAMRVSKPKAAKPVKQTNWRKNPSPADIKENIRLRTLMEEEKASVRLPLLRSSALSSLLFTHRGSPPTSHSHPHASLSARHSTLPCPPHSSFSSPPHSHTPLVLLSSPLHSHTPLSSLPHPHHSPALLSLPLHAGYQLSRAGRRPPHSGRRPLQEEARAAKADQEEGREAEKAEGDQPSETQRVKGRLDSGGGRGSRPGSSEWYVE